MSNKEVKDLIKRINASPDHVVPDEVTGSGHRYAYRQGKGGGPVGTGVPLPATPSDSRWLLNARGDLWRLLRWDDPSDPNFGRRKKRNAKNAGHGERRPDRRGGHNMPRVAEIARVTTSNPKPDLSGPPRPLARYLWERIIEVAAQDPASAFTHEGQTGHKWAGRFRDLMSKEYPAFRTYSPRDQNLLLASIRVVLKQDDRAVLLSQGNRSRPSTWWVRADWNDPGPARTEVAAQVDTSTSDLVPVADDNGPSAEGQPKSADLVPVAEPQTVTTDVDERPAPTVLPGVPSVDQMFAFVVHADAVTKERDRYKSERKEVRPLFERLAVLAQEFASTVEEIGGLLGERDT